MQNSSFSGEDDSGFSQLHTTTGYTSRYGYIAILCLVVVFLGSCLIACSVNPGCGSTDLNSTCSSPSHSMAVASSTTTNVSQRSTPTATPTAKPTQTVSPSSAVGNASPTPATLTDKDEITNDVGHYEELVLGRALYKAYNLLDVSVRDQEPYSDFMYNPNYTLNNRCWKEGQITVSQKDSQTWNITMLMQQVSCDDGTVLVNYSWHFAVRMIDNLPEIISIGLYPTGTSN